MARVGAGMVGQGLARLGLALALAGSRPAYRGAAKNHSSVQGQAGPRIPDICYQSIDCLCL